LQRFLAVEKHKLSVLGQKLSVAVYINQSLKPFLFLILKRSLETPPPERAQNAGDGGGKFANKKGCSICGQEIVPSNGIRAVPAFVRRFTQNTIA
jgi:hypothetical protein